MLSDLELSLLTIELALVELSYPWPWWAPVAAIAAILAAAAIGVRLGRRWQLRRWRRRF